MKEKRKNIIKNKIINNNNKKMLINSLDNKKMLINSLDNKKMLINSLDNKKMLINSLDKINSTNILNNNEMSILIEQTNIEFNKKYKNYYSDKTNNLKNADFLEDNKSIKLHINGDISNLNDLINLINKNPLISNIEYNIDLKILHIIKSDLIKLNSMIGMEMLKTNIVNQILYYIQKLYNFDKDNGDFMHTVLYGPPGTGKTEIAKIIGSIFSKMNILSENKFKKVTRADLVAGYLGQTALKTKKVINEALGGVLFIDEAYSLGNHEKKDSFAKECIDILCEALSDHKSNLMVIIAGYEEELNQCFFSYNSGLESRFVWKYKIEEYNGEELLRIFLKKVHEADWEIKANTNINKEWFEKNLKYFKHFGRSMEILFTKTKIAHSKRIFSKKEDEKKKIILLDLENGFEMLTKDQNTNNDNIYKLMYM